MPAPPPPTAAPTGIRLDAGSDSGVRGDGLTNDATPTLTGKAEPNAEVTIRNAAGTSVATARADAGGNWSATPAAALPDGVLNLQAVANTGAGAADSPAVSITLTIDTSAPSAPVSRLAPTSDSGTAGDNVTNDRRPTISGTGAAGDTVRVTLPGGAVLATTVAADGSWSVTPGSAQALATGSNTLSVTATDAAGNSSAAVNLVLSIVTLGPQAPTVTLDPATDSGARGDRLTNDTTPTISGTGTPGDMIRVTLPGGSVLTTTVAADGSWSATPSDAQALATGSSTLAVAAVDPAGNASATIPLTIAVDTAAPSTPVAVLDPASDSGTPGDNVTNDRTPTISGTGAAGDTIQVTLPSGVVLATTVAADGTWSVTPGDAQALAKGSNTLAVLATDAAGNSSAATNLVLSIVTIGPQAPTVALDPASDSGILSDRVTNDTTPTISGTGTRGDTIRVALPGGAVLSTTVAADGTWSVTPGNAQALATGSGTLSVTAVDPAGNASAAIPLTIAVDTAPPSTPVVVLDPASDSGVAGDNVTNDRTPTISGTGSAGDTIRVTLPGGVVLATTVAADGTWSVTPGSAQALATGSNTLSVTATDPAGNSSAAANLVLSIVTLGPQAPSVALDPASDSGAGGDRLTNDTTPTISGTGAAGDTIRVTLPDGTVLTTTVAPSGTWSVTPGNAQALPNGPNALTVSATDPAGNVSPTIPLTITVDTLAPAAPVAVLDRSSDSGVSGDRLTNDTTPTILGTGTAGDTIRVTLPGGAVLATTVAADGTWSVTPGNAQALANGPNALTVTATDPAGNASATIPLTITVDTAAPSTPVAVLDPSSDSGVAGDNVTNDRTPTISGTGAAGDTIRVTLPGGAVLATTVAADGSWSVTPADAQALPNGRNTLTVTATDSSGNGSAPGSLTVTVDTTAPAAPVAALDPASDSGARGDRLTNDATPTISGTGTPGDTIRVMLPGGAVLVTTVAADGSWSVTPADAQALAPGSSTLSVTATDPAGNSSAAANLVLSIVTIGPQAPTVALDPASDSGVRGDRLTNDTTPMISGTGTAGDTIRVALPSGAVLSTTVAADGTWSVTPGDAQALATGSNTLSVTAVDSSGNASAAIPLTIAVDTVAPTAPVAALAPASDSGSAGDNVTNDRTPTISGTGAAGDTIRVTFPGGAVLTTTVAADGTWSVTPSNAQALASGSNTLSVTATDAAGNSSAAANLVLSIVTLGPQAPTAALDPASDSGLLGDRVTSDTTPTISGTGTAGDTIRVALPSGAVLTTTVAADGTWSVTPSDAQALPSGPNALTVTATDSSGNGSAPGSLTVTVDTTAPAAPVAALDPASDSGARGDRLTNDATPTISGTGTPGDTIRVMLPGGAVLVTTVAADGSWSVTPADAQALAPGSSTLSVTATDPAGNASATIPLTITVDTAAPAAPVAALDPASDSGASGDNVTNDRTPTISGTGTAGDTIRVTLPGGEVLATTVAADGSWSVTPGSAAALATGSNTLSVTATDAAGNSSAAANLVLSIVTIGPQAPTVALDPASDSGVRGDRLTNDTTPMISGTGTAGDTIRVALPIGAVLSTTVAADGTWSVTPSDAQALPDGPNTVSVTATDSSGNRSAPSSVTITVDTTAPSAPSSGLAASSDSGAAGDDLTNDRTPTIAGTGAAGDTIRVVLPGGAVLATTVAADGTWSVTPGDAQALATGSSTISVTATDPAGNVSNPVNRIITIDTTAPGSPTVVLDRSSDSGTAGDNVTNDRTPTLSGTGTAGDTIRVTLPGGAVLVTTVAADGTWSVTPGNAQALAPGPNTLGVTATDPAGNSSAAANLVLSSVTLGPQAPTAVLDPSSDSGVRGDRLTSDATPTIAGTGTAGDTIRVTLSGGAVLATTVAPYGTWSVTPGDPQALANGSHTLWVTLTDAAGNVSAPTPVALIVDTLRPDAPTMESGEGARINAAENADGVALTLTSAFVAGDTVFVRVTPPDGGAAVTVSRLVTSGEVSAGRAVVQVSGLATQGEYAATGWITDAAGNVGPDSGAPARFVLDTVAPVAPTATLAPASDSGAAGDNVTNDRTPTISGTGTAGDTIRVTLPGGAVLATTVALDGTWSVTPSDAQALALGSNTLSVTATDAAGNRSSPTSLVLSIVTSGPQAPTVALDPASDSGLLGDRVTNDAAPTISGTGTAGDTIRVTLPGGAVLATTVAADGTWSVTPGNAQALANGPSTVTVTALDPAGNASSTIPLTITVDTAAPSIPVAVLDPASDSGALGDNVTNDRTPTISGTGTAGDTIRVALPDGAVLVATVAADGTWSVTPGNAQALAPGSNTLVVTATDPAGNSSAAANLVLSVVTTGPQAPTAALDPASDSGILGDRLTNDTTPTISGTGTAVDTIRVTLPDGAVLTTTVAADGKWSVTPSDAQALAPGSSKLSVTATDSAGNVSSTIPLTITVDSAAPSTPVAVLDPASDSGAAGDNVTNDRTPTLSGTGTAGDTIRVTLPGGAVLATTVAADGTWSVTPSSAQALATGSSTLSVTATDPAGNSSAAASLVLSVVTIGPRAPTAALDPASDSGILGDRVTSDTTPTIAGTGTAGDTIRLTLPDGTVLTTSVAADGSWSVTPANAQALPDGPNRLTVAAVDTVGNASSATPLIITVDSAAAAPSSIDLAANSDTGRSDTDNVTRLATPSVTGSGAEPGATVTLYDTDGSTVLGTGFADAGGNWSITSTTLSAGAHSLTARQTDPAGNRSAPTAGLVVTIDTSALPPSVPDLLPGSDSGDFDSDNLTRDTTPVFRGAGAEPGATVVLYDTDGGTVLGTGVADVSGRWSITSSALSEGSHTLRARQTDIAGNTSLFSASLGVTIDTRAAPPSAPDLADESDSGPSNTDDVTRESAPRVTGTGAESGATVTLYDTDGTTVLGTATADGGGNWSINSSALTVGTHTLTARQTDRAGNTSEPSAPLVVTIEPEVLALGTADLAALEGYLGLSVDAEGVLRPGVVDSVDLPGEVMIPSTVTPGLATEETSRGSAIDLLLAPPGHAGSSLAMLF